MAKTLTIVQMVSITIEYPEEVTALDTLDEVRENMDWMFEYNRDGIKIIKSSLMDLPPSRGEFDHLLEDGE